MPILGLIGTEQFNTERFKNYRRSVFYQYPGGAAPLMGLLSLMDGEMTDDPKYNWYEKRMAEQRTLTDATGPILQTSTGGAAADPLSLVAGTEYRLVVDSTTHFRVSHVIRAIFDSGTLEVIGVVTAIVSSTVLQFRATAAVAGIDNTTGDNDNIEVLVIGSANAQGALAPTGETWTLPTGLENYCQIFRTPFSFSGTALKTGAKFDKTGPYKDKAKENSLNHMIEMEKAFLFGSRSAYLGAAAGANAADESLPTFTTGGILWFLQQWEAGTTYGNTAATADTDDTKRIIANAAGTLNEAKYDGYLERVFRFTNNMSNEKLVLCGSGFLSVINQLYKSKSVLQGDFPSKDAYGMSVVRHVCPFGTLFYKTHPLFSQNAVLRYNALILDVPNLKYRYMQDRDTKLLKNRQANDADHRKDEWLSECGLEMRFPESCMYLQNITSYA